jgi:hypothetical protein
VRWRALCAPRALPGPPEGQVAISPTQQPKLPYWQLSRAHTHWGFGVCRTGPWARPRPARLGAPPLSLGGPGPGMCSLPRNFLGWPWNMESRLLRETCLLSLRHCEERRKKKEEAPSKLQRLQQTQCFMFYEESASRRKSFLCRACSWFVKGVSAAPGVLVCYLLLAPLLLAILPFSQYVARYVLCAQEGPKLRLLESLIICKLLLPYPLCS